MKYDDFDLRIEPRQDEAYPLIVLNSPSGEGRGLLRLPRQLRDLLASTKDLGLAVRASSKGAVPVGREIDLTDNSLSRIDPREIGDLMFQALMPQPVRGLFDRSVGGAESHKRGLRLRLHADMSDPDLLSLFSLPWELIFWKERGQYLSLARSSPFVRAFDVPRPVRRLELAGDLRILVAMASPRDLPPLDLKKERSHLETVLGPVSGVSLHFLEHATPEALRRILSEETFQAFHFMGHGGFDPETGKGVLAFEDGIGGHRPLPGPVLAALMQDFSSLQFAFLNACHTARTGPSQGLNPLAGVSSALVLAGLPAVVAMQFPISDEAAIVFSEAFYRLFAAGEPVDAATAEGRIAIHLGNFESLEWATPVLFLRASNHESSGDLSSADQSFSSERSDTDLPHRPYIKLYGRDEYVEDLCRELGSSDDTPFLAIHGMGGIGKTALTHEIARKCLAKRYFEDVIWLQSTRTSQWIDSPEVSSIVMTFESILARIAQHLRIFESEISGRVIERLVHSLKKRRTLLVLDNMETSREPQEEIALKLQPLLARTPTGVLITSRKRFKYLRSFELRGLETEDSQRFLRHLAASRRINGLRVASDADLTRIAQSVGGSPLAMKLVAGQLQYATIPQVLQRLEKVDLRQWDSSEDDYVKLYHNLFWWSWSCARDNARDILLRLAWYDPFEGALQSRLLARSGMQELDFMKAVENLWELSLLEVDSEPGVALRYSLHPLTQHFVEQMAEAYPDE